MFRLKKCSERLNLTNNISGCTISKFEFQEPKGSDISRSYHHYQSLPGLGSYVFEAIHGEAVRKDAVERYLTYPVLLLRLPSLTPMMRSFHPFLDLDLT